MYQEGDILTRPTLANTLKEIAANGVDAFYKGSIADKIVADLQRRGSIITKEDLLQYRYRMILVFHFFNNEVLLMCRVVPTG